MQIINLYTKELKPKFLFLSFSTLVITALAMICMFAFIGIYAKYNVNEYYKSVEAIEKIKFSKEKNLILLKNTLDFNVADGDIDNVTHILEVKNRKIALLKNTRDKINYSYSTIFNDIAENIEEEMYLESILISDGTKNVKISGKSKSLRNVSSYLHALKKTKSLSDTHLIIVEATKNNENHKNDYSFVLGGVSVP